MKKSIISQIPTGQEYTNKKLISALCKDVTKILKEAIKKYPDKKFTVVTYGKK